MPASSSAPHIRSLGREPSRLPRLAAPACPSLFSLDVKVAAQEHRTADRLERCGSSMEDSVVRQAPGRPGRAARPGFDLMASKLRRPAVHTGTVPRSSLIDRLVRDDFRPVVSVVAPPGYGKTTLLSQWAERDHQSFAWVSLDERDNEPKVLLTYVAEALHRVQPVGERVFEAL